MGARLRVPQRINPAINSPLIFALYTPASRFAGFFRG
jgi:hypothetical protein